MLMKSSILLFYSFLSLACTSGVPHVLSEERHLNIFTRSYYDRLRNDLIDLINSLDDTQLEDIQYCLDDGLVKDGKDFVCTDPGHTFCAVDNDCPVGYYCDYNHQRTSRERYVCNNPDQTPCTTDDDCPENYYCYYNVAKDYVCNDPDHTFCEDDSDCPRGYYCDYNHKRTDREPYVCNNQAQTPCATDDDCPGGHYCLDDVSKYFVCNNPSHTPCTSDYDCPRGYNCNYNDHRSDKMPYKCSDRARTPCFRDKDCPDGYYCLYGDRRYSGIRTCRDGSICNSDDDCYKGGSCQNRND